MDRRLGGPQSQSEHGDGEKKKTFQESNSGRPARSLVTILTELSQLLRINKVKVKLSLCFNWAPRHESVLGQWRYSSTAFTSALDGREWSASRYGRFIPRERAPGTHWIGGWCTFHRVVEKQNPYQNKNRRRRPDPTPASLLCPPYNISYLSWAAKAVCWCACVLVKCACVYGVCIVKNKIENETNLTDCTSNLPNLT
jgi:hypothetical protein